jgi:hypothetical protein
LALILNGLNDIIIDAVTTIRVAILFTVISPAPLFRKNSTSVCISLDSCPVKYNKLITFSALIIT